MGNNFVLKAENIFKSYKTKTGAVIEVLKGANLEIRKGEFVTIVGPSGVGKSTLLHILGTLDKPDSGNLFFNFGDTEKNIKTLKSNTIAEIRNSEIGFVFQFHHLLPEFSAIENVMMPALIAGKSRSEAKKSAELLLETVGVAQRKTNKPSELSGGEQQRIAIARALINKPSIVFADEPTGNLDSKNSDAILKLISQLREEFSLTFVVATHSSQIAASGDRLIKMKDGTTFE